MSTAGNIALCAAFAAVLATCGPSTPPRTVVTSSAAEVSAAEGVTDTPPLETDSEEVAEPETQDGEEEVGVRRGGSLVVRSPVDTRTTVSPVGFRRDVEGPPLIGQERVWVGTSVPDFVDLTDDDRELTTLDSTREGYLAVYRAPLGSEGCSADSDAVCKVSVILYSANGKKLWSYQLGKYLGREDHLRVYDVRYEPPYLLFNQACKQPDEDDEQCGVLVAVDTRESKLHFRSPANVSAGPIITTDKIILTSAPRDRGAALSVVSLEGGVPLSTLELAIRPLSLELEAGGAVTATDATGKSVTVRLSPENRLQAAR